MLRNTFLLVKLDVITLRETHNKRSQQVLESHKCGPLRAQHHATFRDKKRTEAVSTARTVVLRLRSSPDSTRSRRVGCGPAADTPLLRHYLFRRVMILTAEQAARNMLPPTATANQVAVPTYGELANLIWLSILRALYTLG